MMRMMVVDTQGQKKVTAGPQRSTVVDQRTAQNGNESEIPRIVIEVSSTTHI